MPSDDGRFTGKHILITGATNGIGRAGARLIAGQGGTVFGTGTDAGRIEQLRPELPGGDVWPDDASSPDTGTALAARLGDRTLDGLWLNAGYADVRPVEEVDAEFFDRMMAVNVRAPFLQLAALGPHLRDGAAVVVTSSTGAVEGSPTAAVYAATKGAVEAAARGWATAFAPRGIRVNVLVPGNTDTDFRRFMDDDARASFDRDVIGRVPLGRAGTADEVAAVAAFLLGDESSYVTASRYYADGGLTRR